MQTYASNQFLRNSLDKISDLVVMARGGRNEHLTVDKIIQDVFFYLGRHKPRDPDAILWAFKNGLMALADRADDGMSHHLREMALRIRMICVVPE
ncbi:hypothetical protein ACIPF8_22870 [Collimonas sp. NPDC087041]|uniref:hypothetical protein n=1 Tax=Collimonas sp. NPDC087041 TaxID=3363960 RepID=UPI0038116860